MKHRDKTINMQLRARYFRQYLNEKKLPRARGKAAREAVFKAMRAAYRLANPNL